MGWEGKALFGQRKALYYGIGSELKIFKDGQLIGRLMGPHPSRLKNEIDNVLTKNGIAVA